MEQAALVFDFFHEAMTGEERREVIDWLNAHLDVYRDDETPMHNSIMPKINTYLDIAWATWDENPRAKEFRDYALKKLYEGELVPVLTEFGAGGGHTECGWYVRASLYKLVEAIEKARRFDGYDGFARVPGWFYERLACELQQPYPPRLPNGAGWYAPEGDARASFSPAMQHPQFVRIVLSQYFRGSDLAGYAAGRRRETYDPECRVLEFLYEEEADPVRDMKDFPLAHLAAGIGKVFARSDWSEDATWLRFECGDWWSQHQHFESGNFEIFRREPLATESGNFTEWYTPHDLNWLIRTVAHNCILINKPDEKWYNLGRRSDKVELANDGGQGANTFHVVTLEEWKRRHDEHFERGDIAAYEDRPEFLYVAGDSTKAYAASKAKRVLRQIVFIRPCTFVMLDRVSSVRAEYAKTWLLHCHNEPVLEERTIRIENGKGKLSVQVLLPEDAAISKVEGFTYGANTYEPARSRLWPPEFVNRWRVEVRPGAPRTDDVFLHVLSTADVPESAQLVQEDGLVGARGKGWQVLFDDKLGGTITLGETTFLLRPGVRPGAYEK
jgi:hypothetical protein